MVVKLGYTGWLEGLYIQGGWKGVVNRVVVGWDIQGGWLARIFRKFGRLGYTG